MSTTQIRQGMPVFGRNGNQIGTVKAVNQNHILIDRSWQRDVWAPTRAVQSVAGGAVRLDVDENQIDNRNWPNPPLFGPSNYYQSGRGYGTYSGAGYPGYAETGYYGNRNFGGYGNYGVASGYDYNRGWSQNQGYGSYMSGGGYGSYGNPNWNQNRSTWMWPGYTNWGAYGTYGTQRNAGFGGYGSYGAGAGVTSYTIYGPETGSGYTGGYGAYGRVGRERNVSEWNSANWGTNSWASASDQEIENEICRRLTQAGNVDASDIEVTVDQRVVTLSGTVDSRQAKREAGSIADSIPGVEDVNNNLRVDQGLLGRVESTL